MLEAGSPQGVAGSRACRGRGKGSGDPAHCLRAQRRTSLLRCCPLSPAVLCLAEAHSIWPQEHGWHCRGRKLNLPALSALFSQMMSWAAARDRKLTGIAGTLSLPSPSLLSSPTHPAACPGRKAPEGAVSLQNLGAQGSLHGLLAAAVRSQSQGTSPGSSCRDLGLREAGCSCRCQEWGCSRGDYREKVPQSSQIAK